MGTVRSVFHRNEIDILFLKELRDRTGYLRNGIGVVYLIDCLSCAGHQTGRSLSLVYVYEFMSRVTAVDAPSRTSPITIIMRHEIGIPANGANVCAVTERQQR